MCTVEAIICACTDLSWKLENVCYDTKRSILCYPMGFFFKPGVLTAGCTHILVSRNCFPKCVGVYVCMYVCKYVACTFCTHMNKPFTGRRWVSLLG